MSGMPVRSLVQKLEETESALLAQQKELAAARAALADISVDHDEILERLFLMAAGPGGPDKHAALREELARIVSQIVVHQDGRYIRVTFKGEMPPVGLSVISCSRHNMLPRRMHASQTESQAGGSA
ncbi:hypothetical protein, partial [Ralstonia pseudosolanacearum]|uniref:hypothetical protein n=1 Tax=Ralstonia pseudosolanacearum TaxID=1310165 RepID=UPI001FF7458B